MLTDSHVHLSFVKDKSAFLKSTLASKIKPVFMGVDESSVNDLVNLCKSHNIAFFAGFHPLFLDKMCVSDRQGYIKAYLDRLFTLHNSVIKDMDFYNLCGLGEIGIDKRASVSAQEQIAICKAQLDVAFKYKKAVSLHVVKGHDLMLSLLSCLKAEHKLPVFCIHGATLSYDLLKAYSSYNAYFSFGSNLIKKKMTADTISDVKDTVCVANGNVKDNVKYLISDKCQTMLKLISKDRIFIESDYDGCSDIYPHAFLHNVYKSVAEILDLDEKSLERLVSDNLYNFIGAKSV